MWIIVRRFVPVILSIVLSVLLRFTTSDYHFGIWKLFLGTNIYCYLLGTNTAIY